MKRKLLTLLLSMCLIVPLTACDDNSDEDTSNVGEVSVTVNLVKGNTSGVSFNIADCARIINGPGKYDAGTSAPILVEYYSNACEYHHITDNGVVNTSYSSMAAGSGKRTISFNLNNLVENVNRNIEIVFTGLNEEVTQNKVIFAGFEYEPNDTTSESLTASKFAFPYKTIVNPYQAATKYKFLTLNETYPTVGQVTPETDISTIFDTTPLNLNYAYIDYDGQGLKFNPHKVTWKKGTYSEGSCTFTSATVIDDINTFRVASGDTTTCLKAKVSNTSELGDITNTAISNMLSSEMYIYTEEDNACKDATSANKSVSENCMYALRLNSLYNVDYATDQTADKGVYYYGVNSNGHLEGVTTINNGITIEKRYLLCTEDLASIGTCSGDSALWNTYEYLETPKSENKNTSKNEAYKDLGIASFIDLLGTVNNYGETNTTTYSLSSLDVKYDYNYFIGDIVPVKIGSYYIRYLNKGDGNPTYNPSTMKFSNSLTEHPSNEYSLKINKLENPDTDATITAINTAVDTLVEQVESDKINLMAANDSNMIEALRLKMFELIYAEESQLSALNGYRFDIEVNTTTETVGSLNITNRELEVTLVDATLTKPTETFVYISDSVYCAADNETCINGNAEELNKYINDLVSATNIKNLNFADIKSYEREAGVNVIEFTIIDENNAIVVVEYCDKTFTSKGTTIQYVAGTELVGMNIKTISSEVDAFGVEIEQTATIFVDGKGETIITIGGEPTDVDIEDKIKDIYDIFYEANGASKGKFYDMNGDGIVDLFLNTESKDIYTLSQATEFGAHYEKDYDFYLELVNYRVPKLDYTSANFIKLGDKVCAIENKEYCDETYAGMLEYTDKLISPNEIASITFKSITVGEDEKITYEIDLGGENTMTIVYDPATKEFTMDDKKVIYYKTVDDTALNLEIISFDTKGKIKEGTPAVEKEVDVTQRLTLVTSGDPAVVTSYSITLTVDNLIEEIPVTSITDILKIFYNIGESNSISGLNTEAKWYSITSEYKVAVNAGKIYQFTNLGNSVYQCVDSDENIFKLTIKKTTPSE